MNLKYKSVHFEKYREILKNIDSYYVRYTIKEIAGLYDLLPETLAHFLQNEGIRYIEKRNEALADAALRLLKCGNRLEAIADKLMLSKPTTRKLLKMRGIRLLRGGGAVLKSDAEWQRRMEKLNGKLFYHSAKKEAA